MCEIEPVKLYNGEVGMSEKNPTSEYQIVSNSANSSEQWQNVANSDEQSSIVTDLDLSNILR